MFAHRFIIHLRRREMPEISVRDFMNPPETFFLTSYPFLLNATQIRRSALAGIIMSGAKQLRQVSLDVVRDFATEPAGYFAAFVGATSLLKKCRCDVTTWRLNVPWQRYMSGRA